MFHKVDDIEAMVSPVDLSSVQSVDKANLSVTFSDAELRNSFEAICDVESDKQGFVVAFFERNDVDTAVQAGIQDIGQKVPEALNEVDIDLRIVYDFGVTSFRNAQVADAAYAFTILLSSSELRSVVLLGLAACACQQDDYPTALIFAQESVSYGDAHPRAYLIAGYSALKSGHRKTAKRHLALAARLARGHDVLRDEQRCAQRELLLMQLAS